MFGDLAKFKLGFIFAFNVLPVIIFFSAVIAILYHIGPDAQSHRPARRRPA